jgi:excisionase family DNA binding protein
MKLEERLFSPEEVAERLGMSRYTIGEWLRSGRLKGRRIGRFWRVKASDLQAFIDNPPPLHPQAREETNVDTSQDTKAGRAWVKNDLFARLREDYRDTLRLTDHYGWRTHELQPFQNTFYFEVEGLSDIQLIDVPRQSLDECAHPHNTDERRRVEQLLRQKFECIARAL